MSIQQARQLQLDVYHHIKANQPSLSSQQAWQAARSTPWQDAIAIQKGRH